jgi:hypothetical protein
MPSGKKRKKAKKKRPDASAESGGDQSPKKNREPVHPTFRLGPDQYHEDEGPAKGPVETEDSEESNILRIGELAAGWEAELEELRGQKAVGAKGLARIKDLEMKLQKYAAMEEYWDAARRLSAAEGEGDELARKQIEDREKLKKLETKSADAKAKFVALSEQRTTKQAALKRKTEDQPSSEMEDARSELEPLEEEIRRADADVKLYSMQVDNLRGFIGERRRQLMLLEGKIDRMRLELVPLGAEVARYEGIELADAESRNNPDEKNEEVNFRKPTNPKLMAVKEAAAKLAKDAGGKVARSPMTLPALGVATGLGVFTLFGGALKSWGRRLKNPHRFWDELIKRFNTDFDDPPKGKGFVMGGASFLGWFLFGETKMAAHDTVHKDFV